MTAWDVEWVRARVREMADRDPGLTRFGARTHRYVLAPPLPEGEIRSFEETHGIRLPADYRSFVGEVGDGPAGPSYGLMPLTVPRADVDDDWAVDEEWRDDRRPGRLSEPFPLTEPLPGAIGAPTEGLTPGTLMLAEDGCAMYTRLVLNGPHAGQIWHLDPDWGGFVPTAPDFRTWYMGWLTAP